MDKLPSSDKDWDLILSRRLGVHDAQTRATDDKWPPVRHRRLSCLSQESPRAATSSLPDGVIYPQLCVRAGQPPLQSRHVAPSLCDLRSLIPSRHVLLGAPPLWYEPPVPTYLLSGLQRLRQELPAGLKSQVLVLRRTKGIVHRSVHGARHDVSRLL